MARSMPPTRYPCGREYAATIDDDDGVVACKRHGVFDGRVASTYDYDRFALIFIGVVQRVLHDPGIFSRHAQ